MNQETTTKNSSVLKITNAPRALIAKAVIERISMLVWKGDIELLDVISVLFILKALYGDGIVKDYQNDAFEIAEVCKQPVFDTLHYIDELVTGNYITREGSDIYLPPFKETAPEKCIDITYYPDGRAPLSEILTERLLEVLNPAVLEELKTTLDF